MPVRIYHRTRIGKNSGVVFSTSDLTQKERAGCAWLLWQTFYWLAIGWWWKPLKWFVMHLPGWVNSLAELLERFTPLAGARAKFVAWGAVILVLSSCCLLSYAQTQTPEAKAARAATQTMQAMPTATLTPSKTPKPTAMPSSTPKRESRNEPKPTPWESPVALITPTAPVRAAPIVPVIPSGGCDCGRDYDCGDFSSHAAAQACYDSCGGGGWSKLDGNDGDGRVCEALP